MSENIDYFLCFVYLLDDFLQKDSFDWFKLVRFSSDNNIQSGDGNEKSIIFIFIFERKVYANCLFDFSLNSFFEFNQIQEKKQFSFKYILDLKTVNQV